MQIIDQTSLLYWRLVLSAELSFYEFVKQAWPHVEGAKKPYVDNWHMKAMCDHMQAVHERRIMKLLLNLSPRCGKSTILDVMFVAWIWTTQPHWKFLYASHSQTLAKRDSIRCRDLILSNWYQERWGEVFKLIRATEKHLENDHKGYRMITSPTSRVTGEGGDYLIADDLNDMKEVQSKVKRDSTNQWFATTFSNRINDPATGVIIVQQQRGNQEDVAGFIIDHDPEGEYTLFAIPMLFEKARKATTISLDGISPPWSDPRTEEGQLMWPERFSRQKIERIKNTIGSTAFAAQYMQRPSPAEGGIVKKHWFQQWKDKTPPKITFIIQSWDTGISDSPEAAYSACTTWGIFYPEGNEIGNIILLDMWRGRVGYPDLRDRAQRLYLNYKDKGEKGAIKERGAVVDMCLIEAKATGDPLIRDLRRVGIPAVPFNPSRIGDKHARVNHVAHLIEAGLVWVPARPPHFDKLLPYAEEFLDEVALFPNASSRDLVDTMSQVLAKTRDMGLLSHPKDPENLSQNDTSRPDRLY